MKYFELPCPHLFDSYLKAQKYIRFGSGSFHLIWYLIKGSSCFNHFCIFNQETDTMDTLYNQTDLQFLSLIFDSVDSAVDEMIKYILSEKLSKASIIPSQYQKLSILKGQNI